MMNSCRKIRFFPIYFLLFLFAFPSWGFAENVLDIPALKKAIAERTVVSWGEQNPYYKRFSADKVTIEKKIPVQAGDLSLFAVKAVLKAPGDEPDEILFLVVDHTGQLQFADIMDVRTGNSFFMETLSELRRIENLPKDFGTLVFSGKGTHDVVIVSDPFCPYCRKGWVFFQENREKIRSLKLAHLPLHTESELVSLALLDAETRDDRVIEMLDFAYTTLKQTVIPEDLVRQFMDAFPHLKNIWGKDPKKALVFLETKYRSKLVDEIRAARGLGFKATPVFFINGYMIEGYHEKQIRERMP